MVWTVTGNGVDSRATGISWETSCERDYGHLYHFCWRNRIHSQKIQNTNGRGFVMALDPTTGFLSKYDVGPTVGPPIVMKSWVGTHTFKYGPSTSSVWSTPSFDQESGLLFFGTM